MKLKTLKDISCWKNNTKTADWEISPYEMKERVKQKAIKWIMKEGKVIDADDWTEFFNITEDELK